MRLTWLAAFSLLAVGACQALSDPIICPAFVPPSVIVTVEDSVTGANLTPGATVGISGGGYSASVVGEAPATAVNLGEGRTGTFTVTAAQAGYLVWTKTGVEVEEGRCGANTVKLTARLQAP